MDWNDDDPFASDNGDRTIIRPSPGGRSGAAPPPAPAQNVAAKPSVQAAGEGLKPRAQTGGRQSAAAMAPSRLTGSGLNPLVDAATALLILGSKLRSSVSQDNVSAMQDHVIRQLRVFEDSARSNGCEQNAILTARYILCTFLDECVLKTPWGSESQWASQSLLSKFHNETGGGEKFFQLVDRMLQEPSRNLSMLELMYLCLSFGFEGKYMLNERGGAQLTDIRETIYRAVLMQRGDFERELSPHWQGIEDGRTALVKYIPLWVVAALAGVLLIVVYGGFRFILSTTSAPVYNEVGRAAEEQRVDLTE